MQYINSSLKNGSSLTRNLNVCRSLINYWQIMLWLSICVHQGRIYLFKSTMETPEQYVKSVKVNNEDTRTTMASFWCLYCYLWTDFTPCSGVSIADCEQVNAGRQWTILKLFTILYRLFINANSVNYSEYIFLTKRICKTREHSALLFKIPCSISKFV